MIRNIVILKGHRNSGKSQTLRDSLPPMLGYRTGCRNLRYCNKLVFIIRRSIHESPDWQKVVQKILSYKDHIIVIAAWLDEIVGESKCVNETLEALVSAKLPDPNMVSFYEVLTTSQNNENAQKQDQERCANEVKSIIDTL